MEIKEVLKSAIKGTGEVGEALMATATDVIKEGTHDTTDIFGAVIDLGKEGVIDVTVGVKSVFIGAVEALKESGKSTEEAVGEVTTKAEQVIGGVAVGGEDAVGEAARKGIREAKEVVAAPFEKK